VVRLSRASLERRSRRGSDGRIVLPIEVIGNAELAPIKAVFIKATRLTLALVDGRTVK